MIETGYFRTPQYTLFAEVLVFIFSSDREYIVFPGAFEIKTPSLLCEI